MLLAEVQARKARSDSTALEESPEKIWKMSNQIKSPVHICNAHRGGTGRDTASDPTAT